LNPRGESPREKNAKPGFFGNGGKEKIFLVGKKNIKAAEVKGKRRHFGEGETFSIGKGGGLAARVIAKKERKMELFRRAGKSLGPSLLTDFFLERGEGLSDFVQGIKDR